MSSINLIMDCDYWCRIARHHDFANVDQVLIGSPFHAVTALLRGIARKVRHARARNGQSESGERFRLSCHTARALNSGSIFVPATSRSPFGGHATFGVVGHLL